MTDADIGPGRGLFTVLHLTSIPGLRGRFKITVGATTADRPRSVISLKGYRIGIGRASPLREMTSAAFGVGQHSIADVTAVGARCRPSSHRRLRWEFCPVKKGRTRHAHLGILGALDFIRRRWLFGC